MKVEVNEAHVKRNRVFPKLMVNEIGQVIIASKKEGNRLIGTLVSTDEHGYHSNNWMSGEFQDFEGSITLSND